MEEIRNLRVVGSRKIFENFLPSNGDPFERAEFTWVSPNDSDLLDSFGSDRQTLTLVINPEEYGKFQMSRIRGPIGLWFLRSLAPNKAVSATDAPRLTEFSTARTRLRGAFVESLDFSEVAITVVPDSDSREFLQQLGIDAQMSPPPVTNSPIVDVSRSQQNVSFHFWSELSGYSEAFIGSRGRVRDFLRHQAYGDRNSGHRKFVVAISSGLFEGFPYEVAVALVRGYCVLTERFSPQWGFEPGIDFIEFSTPEELERTVDYLRRYPSITKLMVERAQQKSHIFEASGVFGRLTWQS